MTVAIDRILARYPTLAALGYLALIGVLLLVTWLAVSDVAERYQAVDAAADVLAQIEGRRVARPGESAPRGATPTGSPFLEGQTVTVAGAALLQRVADSINRSGGNVLSSQVELDGAQSKNGFVSLIASCELEQGNLQQLLYDLEAGMPFLFVDQLVAQAPATGAEGGRMRVLLAVSGQWQGRR
jgi:general secretion pathway protein M